MSSYADVALADVADVTFAPTSVDILGTGEIGPPGPMGPSGGTVTRTAAETLSGHRVVTLDDDDQAVYAQPDTISQAQPLLTLNAADDGDDVTLLAFGPHTEPSWDWTGDALYLTADGVLSETPPTSGYLVIVADVVNATTVFFNPRPPIALES